MGRIEDIPKKNAVNAIEDDTTVIIHVSINKCHRLRQNVVL